MALMRIGCPGKALGQWSSAGALLLEFYACFVRLNVRQKNRGS
jgi:hypothetical protein